MTMALAVIMIVLLGVMGAGLLTFVSRDLNIVVEENRGQRAFEVAEAGIGAAKRQLSKDCSDDPTICPSHYDYPDDDGTDNIQWAETNSGLTLQDLDGDGDPTDYAIVTIESKGADSYEVISTGHYGTAKRKIEAVFKGVEAPAPTGGDGLGHPLYYTPSDIKIETQVFMNSMSLFTEQDIILEDDLYDGSVDSGTVEGGADGPPAHDRQGADETEHAR